MKAAGMKLAAFVVCGTLFVVPQIQQQAISLGETTLHLDMGKEQALKNLSQCCKVLSLRGLPPNDSSALVTEKDDINQGLGTVFFKDGKVSGIDATRDWSQEPASYATAIALYRLVEEITHGSPTQATVSVYSRKMSSSPALSDPQDKILAIAFPNGRSITIELVKGDPNQHFSGHQVVVSECIGSGC